MTGAAVRPIAPANAIRASDFRPCRKGDSLQGFFILHLPSGMALHEAAYHHHGSNGRRWISLAARPYESKGGKQWEQLISFDSEDAKKKFQILALAAVDKLLASVPLETGGAD